MPLLYKIMCILKLFCFILEIVNILWKQNPFIWSHQISIPYDTKDSYGLRVYLFHSDCLLYLMVTCISGLKESQIFNKTFLRYHSSLGRGTGYPDMNICFYLAYYFENNARMEALQTGLSTPFPNQCATIF